MAKLCGSMPPKIFWPTTGKRTCQRWAGHDGLCRGHGWRWTPPKRSRSIHKKGETQMDLEKLRRGVVANAGRLSNKPRPRFAYVMDAVGCGSTSAWELCRAAGFDPEEVIGHDDSGEEGFDADE